LDLAVMGRLVKLSIGAIFQYLIGVASWIALIRLNASFGAAAIAGYTLAIRMIIFAILPSWGMSNAGATLVGQNLGAGKPDRAEKSVYLAGVFNMVFLGAVGLVFIAFAPWLIGQFTADREVASYAIDCLRLVSLGYIFYAWGMVLTQAFNGAGDTLTPTVINFVCLWMLQLPLAWFLAFHVGHGPRGVFVSIAIAESFLAVFGFLAFRRGKWKLQKV
jgi:Na+-driven multidrug efflux pump